MSSELMILVALSIAAVVGVLALLLAKLVRTLVENPSDLSHDVSQLLTLVARPISGTRRTLRLVGQARPHPGGAQPEASAGEEDRAPVGERPAVVDAEKQTGSRSLGLKQLRPSTFRRRADAPAERVSSHDDADERRSGDYRQLGENVTAVLTAAEQTAGEIREAALREAEQIRRTAEEEAAATLEDAQARRTEAERRASELEAEAVRHRNELTNRTDAQIEAVVSAFRRAAKELEGLLPAEEPSRAGQPAVRPLDDALRPRSSRHQWSSRADK